MDDDRESVRAPASADRPRIGEPLDPLSVDELASRIAALEAEIARTRAHIDAARRRRADAEALFGR